jgi:hypothetical protein
LAASDEKPRFLFRVDMHLSRLSEQVSVENPGLVTDELLDQAWNTMNECIMDILDELGEEPTDEHFREIFIEVCYRLIFREMFTLNTMPRWEESWKERLGTKKKGPPIHKKGSYDDSEW